MLFLLTEPSRWRKLASVGPFLGDLAYPIFLVHWIVGSVVAVEFFELDPISLSRPRIAAFHLGNLCRARRGWRYLNRATSVQSQRRRPPFGKGRAFKSALGLSGPYSHADVVAAFRRKAHDCHPDKGGSPADFQRLVAAKDRALSMWQLRNK